ncbi:MAG: arginase family protein [Candidatus Dormibacteraceae bacterium]
MTPAARPQVSVIGLLSRTSDRSGLGMQGTEALARALASRVGVKPLLEGNPTAVRNGGWEDDLRQSKRGLEWAAARLEESLAEGGYPLLVAAECTVAMGTLPVVARMRPDAWLLWIDSHGDFNSPDTTVSGYLRGMCLAGVCGVWETGLGTGPPPTQVVVCGARNLDSDERKLLSTYQIQQVEGSEMTKLVRNKPLFLHLDLDVLDPSIMPGGAYPSPDGPDEDELARRLFDLAKNVELIGCQITSLTAPELAGRMVSVLAPLLP